MNPQPSETLAPNFVAEARYTERVSFVTRPQHPLACKRRIRLPDLLDAQWILPPPLAPMRQALEHAFHALGLPRPVARIETSSLLLIERSLSQTDSVAALPWSVAGLYEMRGEMKALAMDMELDLPPVGLVTRADAVRAPVVEAFLALVRNAGRAVQKEAAVRKTRRR